MVPHRVLPDTCAWIDFFRGTESPLTAAVARSLQQAETVTCGVVIMELLQGVKTSREESLILNAFAALPHLEMSRELWAEAGRLAARLRTMGQTLPFSDIVIASLALQQHCTLLTVDRHFDLIPGVITTRGDQ
jgi:predicted nucleic acid-binding protein